MTLRKMPICALAFGLLLMRNVKNAIISFVMLISWNPAWASSASYSRALCSLALENVKLLNSLEQPELWMEKITFAFEGDHSHGYVDFTNPRKPKLSEKYKFAKNALLNRFYLDSKSNRFLTITDYVSSLTPPNPRQSVLDYLSMLSNKAATLFYTSVHDQNVAFLNAVNSSLHRLSLQDHDIVAILLGELEVLHPKEYADLKATAQTLSLYKLAKKIRGLDYQLSYYQSTSVKDLYQPNLNTLRAYRGKVAVEFEKRRKLLLAQLEARPTNELMTAIAIFGGDL
jgi:hypothetical protein